jgi:rSAM/selenodomain-associated transferase 1
MDASLTAVDKSVETVDNPRAIDNLAPETEGMKAALGIFAKEPVAGLVKTRLSPPLSPAEAAGLYRTCLEETVAAMSGAGFDPVLFYDGDTGYFRRAFPGIRLLTQGEGDLGARMERALRTLLAGGCEAAALIGSDTPDLPVALVAAAFAALREADVVIAPARDGGYVLIGERRHVPELFRDTPWSTNGVLAATRQRAADLAIDYREVGGWEDVDDLPSLRRLLVRSPASATARHAAGLLARHGL